MVTFTGLKHCLQGLANNNLYKFEYVCMWIHLDIINSYLSFINDILLSIANNSLLRIPINLSNVLLLDDQECNLYIWSENIMVISIKSNAGYGKPGHIKLDSNVIYSLN